MDSTSDSNKEVRLKRVIGLPDASLLILGQIIGFGFWLKDSLSKKHTSKNCSIY